MLYLYQRKHLLPLLLKGIRFIFKYPVRGQTRRNNFKTCKKLKITDLKSYKKKLTTEYISNNFPN